MNGFISDLELTDLEANEDESTMETTNSKLTELTDQEAKHFLSRMLEAFWRLHAARPANTMLAPACLPGIQTFK